MSKKRKPSIRDLLKADKLTKQGEAQLVSKLQSKLKKVLHEFVRLKWADSKGMVQTWDFMGQGLGLKIHYKNGRKCNAGHWIPAKYCPPLKFDEYNIHPQTASDNHMGEGMQYWHGKKIIEVHGQKEFDRMVKILTDYKKKKLKNPKYQHVFTREWLERKIAHYERELNKIKMK